MPHFMIVLIPYINLLNLSWIKKMSIFEEYGAFNSMVYSEIISCIRKMRVVWVNAQDNFIINGLNVTFC